MTRRGGVAARSGSALSVGFLGAAGVLGDGEGLGSAVGRTDLDGHIEGVGVGVHEREEVRGGVGLSPIGHDLAGGDLKGGEQGDDATLEFALAAGTLAAVNPWGFAMQPAYLSMFAVDADQEGRPLTWRAIRRALTAIASMTLGFVAVYGVLGLALTPEASSVQCWLPAVTVVIGALLIGFGVVLLAGRTVAVRVPFLRLSKDPVASPIAMMLYGVSDAVASLARTIGPFLVVTATAFRAGNFTSLVAACGT